MTELHKPEQRALKAHQGYREAIRLESEVCVGDDRVHQVEQRRYDRRHADCKPVAHNGLVGGSSPPGPTTHSRATGEFLLAGELPRIGGVVWETGLGDRAFLFDRPFCPFCLWRSQTRSWPGIGTAGQIKESGRAWRVGETTRLAHRATG